MFWRKQKSDWSVGQIIPVHRLLESTPDQEKFQKIVNEEVERRLALKKAEEHYASLPDYRITSSYDVQKNEDTYHLQSKQWGGGFSAYSYYRTFYSSTDKSGVEARFKRLMPSKKKKKAA